MSRASQPSNPELSERGRAWMAATGAIPLGAGARRMCAERGPRESVVLQRLGNDPNALTRDNVREALASAPGDSLRPNMEAVRDVEMSIVTARAPADGGQPEIDEDNEDVTPVAPAYNNDDGVIGLPAARSLSMFAEQERARLMAADGGGKSKHDSDGFVHTAMDADEQGDAVAAPGGMLEHTNMTFDEATAQMTETQIAMSRLVVKGLLSAMGLRHKSHTQALMESGERPHDVPELSPAWMSFLTRYSNTPEFPPCKNGVNCFGMRLEPPLGQPRAPLVVFHTTAQWSQYIRCGQAPLELCHYCVWCLALKYLSAIHTVSSESTSAAAVVEGMPFRNPVDMPGGYLAEYCARPLVGARAMTLQYAMRMPNPKHFVPCVHTVHRPITDARGIVQRDPVTRHTLCTTAEVHGFVEVAKVLYVDGQQATPAGTRIESSLERQTMFVGVEWEYTLRDTLLGELFGSTALRKSTDTAIQQDMHESDLAPGGELAFVEEDLYLPRILDMTLRPLLGAQSMARRMAAAEGWADDEARWLSWAKAHGLVLTDRTGFNSAQPWDQLTGAVRAYHCVQHNPSQQHTMLRVSTHLFVYMVTARIGLHATLDEMLRGTVLREDRENAQLSKRYTDELRRRVEVFSTGHMDGFELLLHMMMAGRAVNDATLLHQSPHDGGLVSWDALASALHMEGGYTPPSPDMTPHNAWIDLIAPHYADDRYGAGDMQYVRAHTTLVWRPTPVQWIANHRAALACDAPPPRGAGEPGGGGCGDVPATMHTHPPRALGSLLIDPALAMPEWLAHALHMANVSHAELAAGLDGLASFEETWARFNVALPGSNDDDDDDDNNTGKAINTAHWVPERAVSNVVAARVNLAEAADKVKAWNAQVAAVLAKPSADYTVLLALVHTVNEALAALAAQGEVLRRLRLYQAAFEQEHGVASSSASLTEATPHVVGAGKGRNSTQRAPISDEANERNTQQYNTVREIARELVATDDAQRFYDELAAHQAALYPDVPAATIGDAEASELSERLAGHLLPAAARRCGPALFAAPDRPFAPSMAVYRQDADDETGQAMAYVSNNARDPIRMPPHPNAAAAPATGADDEPRVQPRHYWTQSVFGAPAAFRGMYGTWQDTMQHLGGGFLCNATEPPVPPSPVECETAMLRAAVSHWEDLTHQLLTHAQSHFRLALLALDAPGMPTDAYFYEAIADNSSSRTADSSAAAAADAKGPSTYTRLLSLMHHQGVERPTRIDYAMPEAIFSASERFLPDATAMVAAARLFETNPQGETSATTGGGGKKAAGGKKGTGGGGKKPAPPPSLTGPIHDAWMAFLARVMPQATYIVHGVDAMVRGCEWTSFLMLVVRCLRVSLLGGYRYAACDVPPFGTQLEFERLFVHAEDACVAALNDPRRGTNVGLGATPDEPVLALFREFIKANELVAMTAMREYVLRMLEWVPASEANVRRIYRDFGAFRRWTRLCSTMVRIELRTNGGTMVSIQDDLGDALKGRESDKGWAVFHTNMVPAFATEEFVTWMYDRVVSIQVQRATRECIENQNIGDHCIRRVSAEDAQRMLDYVRTIEPGQSFQRHWLHDLGFDDYTVELTHRMYAAYPNVDKRTANFYLYMLPPASLTTMALFFMLLSQHYIHQVVTLPPAYARAQQLALRRAFAVPDSDDTLPRHLTDLYVCSPLACYELLSPVLGRQNAPGKQAGVREDYESGTLFCASRHAQRGSSIVPLAKTNALERAHRQHLSNANAGAVTRAAFQKSRAELVAAADTVARTVVNGMFTFPCAQTPVFQLPTTGAVAQYVPKRKKRSMIATEATRCTRCGRNAVFHVNNITTNGFLCPKCAVADVRAFSSPQCVVCARAIATTNDKEALRQHNKRIAGERRQERAKVTDRHDARNLNQLHDAAEAYLAADTTPNVVLLADDVTDCQVRPFLVCCLCWLRWMPGAQTAYARSEFVHAAQKRVNHPAELFPHSLLADDE